MGYVWRRKRKGIDLERELRANRPEPREDFVHRLATEVRGQRRSRSSVRLAFAGALTAVMLTAFAAVGGVGYAADATGQAVTAVVNAVSSSGTASDPNSPADDQYNCDAGRGNGSEGDDSGLVDPHAGGTGPGSTPTADCDPGNSGDVNQGGD